MFRPESEIPAYLSPQQFFPEDTRFAASEVMRGRSATLGNVALVTGVYPGDYGYWAPEEDLNEELLGVILEETPPLVEGASPGAEIYSIVRGRVLGEAVTCLALSDGLRTPNVVAKLNDDTVSVRRKIKGKNQTVFDVSRTVEGIKVVNFAAEHLWVSKGPDLTAVSGQMKGDDLYWLLPHSALYGE